jgi:transaldolase
MKNENPLRRLRSLGQSVWLDYIHRSLIESGGLKRLVAEDGLGGITSNPTIFEEAIEGSDLYDEAIKGLGSAGKSPAQIYEAIATEDVGRAADILRPVFDKLGGGDGYVSIEVNPHLAHDAQATVVEARRLWKTLSRPNVLIKVPAAREGLEAYRRLITEGINVNVTLLFGLDRYRMVADAYLAGLEDRAALGMPVSGIASVASFFLSRIDVLVDPMLEKAGTAEARKLRGQVAISCAKVAYRIYKEIFGGERFANLAGQGAAPQRLLWASTGVKDPEYSDTKYVDSLIGPHTINTIPMKTLEAYRDHGDPKARLEENLGEAEECLARLGALGIDIDEATRRLEDQGIEKFNKPYDSLMANIQKKSGALSTPGTG